MRTKVYKIVLGLIIVASIALFFLSNAAEYFSFSFIAEHRDTALAYVSQHLVLSILIFCAVYIVLTAVSFPAATVMTIAGGALFGLGLGTLVSSFSSVIGATIAMLIARFLISDSVLEKRFSGSMQRIRDIVNKNMLTSLLTLRLAPLFPFFLLNITMGLTNIRVIPYIVVSVIGMLPGTIIYVYVGDRIADISSPADIVSFEVLAGLTMLACFPIIMKYLAVKLRWYHT